MFHRIDYTLSLFDNSEIARDDREWGGWFGPLRRCAAPLRSIPLGAPKYDDEFIYVDSVSIVGFGGELAR